jgi:hypothetical protein
MIVTYPVGGVVWDYGQYLLGLEELGYEVWYLEDTGCDTYDPVARTYSADCEYGLRFLKQSLASLSPELAHRWAFRDMHGKLHGIGESQLNSVMCESDLLLNVSGGTLLRDAYMANTCKVLIDSDPGWNHFVNYPRWDAQPGWQGSHGFRAHDFHFTYAERIGHEDCLLPDFGIRWLPTRPPVALDRWQWAGAGDKWTTVMTWNNFRKPVEYQGKRYGTKEREFVRIEAMPTMRRQVPFELAVGGSDPPISHWRGLGWSVVEAQSVSETPERYRAYIEGSRGELSVAKNLYVETRSGWFSCRSICYLAASRPVIVQDTGFSEFLPVGEGLFAFDDGAQALDALDKVEADYPRHQRAAREFASEFFSTGRVLAELLRRVGQL